MRIRQKGINHWQTRRTYKRLWKKCGFGSTLWPVVICISLVYYFILFL